MSRGKEETLSVAERTKPPRVTSHGPKPCLPAGMRKNISAPDASLFELFLPWIQKIMQAYEIQSESEDDLFSPKSTKFPKRYYMKNVN